MRKFWPLTMTAAYLLCHALLYLVGWLRHLPPEFSRTFSNGPDIGLLWHVPPETPRVFRDGPNILGGVLFAATFSGMRWTQLGRHRIASAAVVLVALLGQGGLIYIDFDTAKSAAFLAEFRHGGDNRISRLPDAAMRSNRGHPGHSGRIAAQFYFEETGVAVSYRDESDEVRMFEPNERATALREGTREGRELLEKSRPTFRAYALTFRWLGYSNLCMAAASVFFALGLFWQRKSRVTVDAAAKFPMPSR
jgi:hypothetical protein